MELTSLALAALRALSDGSETTLLVMELVNDSGLAMLEELDLPVSEEQLFESLSELESEGLVVRKTDHLEGVREPGVGIPELVEGRREVDWWWLNGSGRDVVADEVKRRGW